VSELDEQDTKLITLARGSRVRINARHGAAVRDETGRSYTAADVDLEHLQLSAVQLAVAQAVAAGARGLEAVAIVGATPATEADLAAVRDVGGIGVPIIEADVDGSVRQRLFT